VRAKWLYVIGGAIAVLVLGLVVVGARGGTDEPVAGPRKVQATPTPRAPETHPTQGEYVPPRPVPETRAPRRVVPTRESRPPQRPERRHRGDCPPRWDGIPFLKKWCERNGYRTR
jgi:hypothetical protein